MDPEKELISKSRSGDAAAFERLVNLYTPRIRRLSHSVCSSLPAEAEDVFQEAFINALKNIKSFKGNSDFGTWLYRITSNLCWKRHRQKKRSKTVSLHSTPHEDGAELKSFVADRSHRPDAIAEKKELQSMIAAVLHQLPDDYRQILVMSDLNEWPNSKIANELKMSLPGVKSRLHRARSLLKKSILGYGARGNDD